LFLDFLIGLFVSFLFLYFYINANIVPPFFLPIPPFFSKIAPIFGKDGYIYARSCSEKSHGATLILAPGLPFHGKQAI